MQTYTFPVQLADVPNLNNHVYPKEVLEKAVLHFRASSKPLVGTLGMNAFLENPKDPTPLNVISHEVTNLKMVDDTLMAEILILDTPTGNKLQDMINSENIAFRIAGIGSVVEKEDGTSVVGYDFNISSINACSKTDAA